MSGVFALTLSPALKVVPPLPVMVVGKSALGPGAIFDLAGGPEGLAGGLEGLAGGPGGWGTRGDEDRRAKDLVDFG